MKTNINKTGVLLVNLGTPRSSKRRDIYRYLIEFLTDARVIDFSWLKRQLLVRGLIVPFRIKQSAEQYRHLWTEKGSPLLSHGVSVQEKLQAALGESYHVVLAMRYQYPSIKEGLKNLKKEQVKELIILPLFPQYASATTGSVYQKVMEELLGWEVFPKITFIPQFFNQPLFIEAICERAKEHSLDSFDHFIFSFHGLPERHIKKIDYSKECLTENCCLNMCSKNQSCYKAQCYSTAQLISQQLELSSNQYSIGFQSRLGKEPWIQPYMVDLLKECIQNGKKKLLVFSPSFVCDCLETTMEIQNEYKSEFIKLGGEDLQLVTGLNDHPTWIKSLKKIVLNSVGE